MISNKTEKLNKYFLLVDIIVTLTLYIAIHFIFLTIINDLKIHIAYDRLIRMPWLLPFLIVIWIIFLPSFNTYPSAETRNVKELFWPILRMLALGGSILGFMFFLTKSHIQSRAVFLIFMLTDFFYLLISRLLMLRIRMKKNNINIVLIKDQDNHRQIEKALRDNINLGVYIKNIITVKNYSGLAEQLEQMVKNMEIDWVIFSINLNDFNQVSSAIHLCEEMGIPTSLVIKPLIQPNISWLKIEEYSGYPMLSFYTTSGKIWALIVKDIIDRILSFLSLLMFSPLALVIGTAIKINSPGPIMFRQKRLGLYGRSFYIYKFRTMLTGSEEARETLKDSNIINGCAFKLLNDPRITTVGKILRRWSLDELPQLINILKGEMSFVGPRPPLPQEVENYKSWHKRRLSMKPGLTCLWQVKGRNDIRDFNTWTEMDLEYIDNWSLWMDLKILISTAPAIISGRGAY
ncbi:MAG: sugar transferase [bacterium]